MGYPAVGDTCQIYSGHCSAVVALMFSSDDRYLFTVGGYDLCIFQWKHLRAEGPLQAKSGMLDGPLQAKSGMLDFRAD
ncbi:hypothetical protein T484DRAFT_1829075 [Baffinella frigidus]|nr:hypothetical protein T484DRAFT_1829075 [Cryptophyta sp. CCMP2293]